MAERPRLDVLVWQRGLAPSRAQAQAMVLAGRIAVDGQRVTRAGARVDPRVAVTRLGSERPYVSRGGEKLAAALAAFAIDVSQRVALDIGASTGGFTDCLLQSGAARVYAVDVGYGQLHWRLRTDPRVVVCERTNARYLRRHDLPEGVDLLTVDVSFISVRLLLPALRETLEPSADAIILIKPQFEVGKGQVGKGGVVRDPGRHAQALYEVLAAAQAYNLVLCAGMVSPLLGPKGNREFLVHLRPGQPGLASQTLRDLCTALSQTLPTAPSVVRPTR
jgi:23S rRNA (cytidine1920-2'-O)/16S rRNA (cytidine1409-2'-O)-methyltransferase